MDLPLEQPRLRRLKQKTTEESIDMHPPAIPVPLELEHVSHEAQEQQEDQPSSPATPASSRKKGKRWETFAESGSEQETAPKIC